MSDKTKFSEIIEKMAKETGKSPEVIQELKKSMGIELRARLEKEGTFRLVGLGTFFLKWSDAREGINPQTGEKIDIPAHNHVAFRPDPTVRTRVNKEFENLKAFILNDEDQKEDPVEETTCKPPIFWMVLCGILIAGLLFTLMPSSKTTEEEPAKAVKKEAPTPTVIAPLQEEPSKAVATQPTVQLKPVPPKATARVDVDAIDAKSKRIIAEAKLAGEKAHLGGLNLAANIRNNEKAAADAARNPPPQVDATVKTSLNKIEKEATGVSKDLDKAQADLLKAKAKEEEEKKKEEAKKTTT